MPIRCWIDAVIGWASKYHRILLRTAWLGLVLTSGNVLAADDGLRISVYATAGDVLRYLNTAENRLKVEQVLAPLGVSRLFLEGRRGGEYVPPNRLREARVFWEERGIECAGGIATVPGQQFGVRQTGGLDWLNWESGKTRSDITRFFLENAVTFDTLMVDDFFCTGDVSPESVRLRGARSWGEYRRDLLVSLIDPIMQEPARKIRSNVRLIIKFPQWYDRFELFGYDPVRMSSRFDQVWVGTEVRNPRTRRMGYVQPTEGYMNFRWLQSIAGDKVVGAWFDHIECGAQHYLDQACQSVLAGARELTLFHLGDLMEGHPGDALLAAQLPRLRQLAGRVRNSSRQGIAFYKPPNGPAGENMYLADYLGMIGLPVLPVAQYPSESRVAFLPAQAAADPEIVDRMSRHLIQGATLIVTPAFIRMAGLGASELAGVQVGVSSLPVEATAFKAGSRSVPFAVPLELDATLTPVEASVRLWANMDQTRLPLLTVRRTGRGQVFVMNTRTFSEQDFLDSDEWLLAPKPRGLPAIPSELGDILRAAWLKPLNVSLKSPSGVALCLFGSNRFLHNFTDQIVRLRLDGDWLQINPNQWLWRD
ncbi:MAG TPA: hypothetical protein P5186_02645 [Candidatus Paceibacterota bacterium]|nr:hypothetical protein [Verrucomicrobiota bacterium]HRY46922.1 hypothetical protein [Candidatus Paceibacterota bacterium]HSA02548.1 hypothetical protein [Candidatus Paceibacterota bacterium]